MSKPIYTDRGTEYPHLEQPPAEFVAEAEEEFADEEVTWPEVQARAWELHAVQQIAERWDELGKVDPEKRPDAYKEVFQELVSLEAERRWLHEQAAR